MTDRPFPIRWLRAVLPPLAVFVVVVVVLEVYLRAAGVAEFKVAKPSAVWRVFADAEQRLMLLASLGKTARAAMIGFAASALLGVAVAIALSASRIIQRAFFPYTVFFQTVPVVAIAPLLVIWFGAGLTAVSVCAFIVSVFPVIANTLSGLLSTDPALRDLFRLHRATPIASLWKLRLPSALPSIFTGLRIAAGLAVIGTVVGEFVAGELEENPGLGILVIQSQRYGRIDLVFAAVLTASLLGLAMLAAINLASYLALRHWHASEQEG